MRAEVFNMARVEKYEEGPDSTICDIIDIGMVCATSRIFMAEEKRVDIKKTLETLLRVLKDIHHLFLHPIRYHSLMEVR